MERETGIEPATNSLEGCDSTTELLPLEFVFKLTMLTPALNVLKWRCTGLLAFFSTREVGYSYYWSWGQGVGPGDSVLEYAFTCFSKSTTDLQVSGATCCMYTSRVDVGFGVAKLSLD